MFKQHACSTAVCNHSWISKPRDAENSPGVLGLLDPNCNEHLHFITVVYYTVDGHHNKLPKKSRFNITHEIGISMGQ